MKRCGETNYQENKDISKNRVFYLFVAALSFLEVITLLFFTVTASKSPIIYLGGAVFFALSGVVWVYLFAKGRRTR